MTIKTSVYLDEVDKRRLTRLARETGTTEAALLRRGVQLVLQSGARPRPHVGVAASSDGRAARDTDALLDDTGFGQ